MCGRCFCTLEPETLSKACSYKDSSGIYKQVPWICLDKENNYKPLTNIGPRDYLPVITCGSHFGKEDDRILIPMLWGMVPSTWVEDPKKHTACTHNARIETLEQTMYKGPLVQGCRCILAVEGFYEWKTTGNNRIKQPYAIYIKQVDKIKVENSSSWTDKWDKEEGWKGINVLKVAGLFKKTKNNKTGEFTYSFSVITRESNDVLSWLHHRMPVILNNQEDEEVWLNYKKYSKDEALRKITKLTLNSGIISWHPVSTNVNDVKNKNSNILMPVKTEENKNQKAKQLMNSWLKKDVKRKSNEFDDENSTPDKKPKLDK